MILNVLKRTVSRVLLILVALGYGVVTAVLTPKERFTVLFLGTSYFAASVFADMKIWVGVDNDFGNSKTFFWQVPVAILDSMILCMVYFSLTSLKEKLNESAQTAKLLMYQRLTRTLSWFVALWVVFALLSVFVSWGWVKLPWTMQWLIMGPSSAFWHIVFLGILLAIAIIWFPSESSSLLAMSNQVPSSEEEAENFELTGGTIYSEGSSASNTIGATVASNSRRNVDDFFEVDLGK